MDDALTGPTRADGHIAARRVLESKREVRDATVDIVAMARRSLSIYTHRLDPAIYSDIDFLDGVKRLILAHAYARVRVLIREPDSVLQSSNGFIDMSRRFTSMIEMRQINADFVQHAQSFVVADDRGFVYRMNTARWEGVADAGSPRIARRHLDFFNEVWAVSRVATQLRQLNI